MILFDNDFFEKMSDLYGFFEKSSDFYLAQIGGREYNISEKRLDRSFNF